MNVLSCFDGLSGGQEALRQLGTPVTNYFASEIDKFAIKIAMKNFPNTIQLGDINYLKGSHFPKIDLLIGGSPCQGFSFAGEQLNFDDPRSKLFFKFADLIDELRKMNPDILFFMENVRMVKKSQDVISERLGVEPIAFNSNLVSGQMRHRLYWTNILGFQMPEDRGVLFQSVLDSDTARIDKAYALTATYHKKGAEGTRQRNFQKSQRPIAWIDDHNTRWLTPIECERLQTLPDNYTEGVSNSQRYKMIGNGWTIEVIKEFFKCL